MLLQLLVIYISLHINTAAVLRLHPRPSHLSLHHTISKKLNCDDDCGAHYSHSNKLKFSSLIVGSHRDSLFTLKGGKIVHKEVKAEQTNVIAFSNLFYKAKDSYLNILPATRIHLTLIVFTTVVHLLGLPAPALFALDPSKLLPQIWRPITSCTYYGPPRYLNLLAPVFHKLYLY